MRNPLRRLSALILGTAVAVSLAACSSDDSDDAAAASGDAAYPVTVTTSTGEVTLTSAPSKIVTLGDAAAENVIALGREPQMAAVSKYFRDFPYMSDFKDSSYIRDDVSIVPSNLDFEKIAKEKPDFIVAPSWISMSDDSVLGKLNDIAPALLFDAKLWEDGLRQVATALGEEDKAESLLEEYDEKVSESAEDVSSSVAGKTFTFGTFMPDGTVWLSESVNNLFEDMGLRPSVAQSNIDNENDANSAKYSKENFSKIDGDFVILSNTGLDKDALPSQDVMDRISGTVIIEKDIASAINNGGIIAKTWSPGAAAELLNES